MNHIFYFIRHGLSEANRDQIVQGQSDFPLAEEGHIQSHKLATFMRTNLPPPDSIIASPLLRARATAETLSRTLDCGLEFDDDWMECRQGKAQGIDYKTAKAWYADQLPPSAYEPIFEDGESQLEIYLRAGRAVHSLMRKPVGTYLVVSHGGILNAAMRVILGIPPAIGRSLPPRFHFDNTGYAELKYEEEPARWHIVRLNATPHLGS